MKRILTYLFPWIGVLMLLACNPEDRSSEQPFRPTLRTIGYEIDGDSCLLKGEVLSSPNSSLMECGFRYGNDTLRVTTQSIAPTLHFSAYTRSLQPGTYFFVAYADNKVGRSFAPDTLYFTIPEE
ncbi:hypothetical protein EVA_08486 [gut metagenome]|uniref:Lipoprotein n=1 Tax=gut metagenome TaxID=749906 RepID=J9CT56_9ZZZZ